jgi:hypothetical protein
MMAMLILLCHAHPFASIIPPGGAKYSAKIARQADVYFADCPGAKRFNALHTARQEAPLIFGIAAPRAMPRPKKSGWQEPSAQVRL